MDKTRKEGAIVVLLIIIILLRAISYLAHYHFILWDESVFMGMGKWIFSNGTIGLWEIIRPIGLPFMLGFLWKIGLTQKFALEVTSVFFLLGTIFLTYILARKIFDVKTALLSSIVLFVTPVFFYYSSFTLTGIPSTFFILLSVFFLIRKKYILSGLFSGVAFLFRYPAALIFVAINLIFLYELLMSKNNKHKRIVDVIKYNVPFISLVGLYLVYNQVVYGSFIEPFLLASAHQSVAVRNVSGVLLSILYYPYTLIITNIFLLFAIFQKQNKKLYYVLLPSIIFLIYFVMIPHKQPRFALMFLPFISILAVHGFFNCMNFLKKSFPKVVHGKRYLAIVSVLLGLILVHPVFIDYKLWQDFPGEKLEIVSDYYEFIKENNISGPILTTDPVINLYSDNKFIQFYNNITDAHLIYDKNINKVSAIVYTPASFPCLDEVCNISKQELEEKIQNDSVLIYNKTWWGELRQVYIRD